MSQSEVIRRNLERVREGVARAADRVGRDPAAVTLVAVTKYVDLDAVRILRDLGVTHFGENRVERARPKIEAMAGTGVVWHMIGNIQRRKTKEVLAVFDRIDALDRLSLAASIQSRAAEADSKATVLVQVNVSGEAQKHGLAPDDVGSALHEIAGLDRLTVRGLMTMAPYDAEDDQLKTIFTELAALARQHALPDVSMGMSGDFALAVEAGSTEIRVGSTLFAE